MTTETCAGPRKPSIATRAELAHCGRFEDRGDRRRGEHVIAEHRKIREALFGGGCNGERGRRRGGLEADGEEDRPRGPGWLRRASRASSGRIDHADVGAVGLGLHQALALRARHAQHVAVGGRE